MEKRQGREEEKRQENRREEEQRDEEKRREEKRGLQGTRLYNFSHMRIASFASMCSPPMISS